MTSSRALEQYFSVSVRMEIDAFVRMHTMHFVKMGIFKVAKSISAECALPF